jgi:hypothetical protein
MHSRWLLAALKPGDNLAELARGLEGFQSDIEVASCGDAAMAEHAADELIVAGVRLEYDVGGGMTELMRRYPQAKLLPEPVGDLLGERLGGLSPLRGVSRLAPLILWLERGPRWRAPGTNRRKS